MKKSKELKYNAWNEHLNNTKERTNYSIRRMDLLIISISGAGIYIIFETLREFKAGEIAINNSNLLLFTGLSFLFAIAINFLSQLSGYHANNFEEKYINLELRKIQGKDIDECIQTQHDKKIKLFNLLTSIFNSASMVLMFIGLLLLTIFNFKLF
ncbi:hypothetical protein [Flavivirga spongiicola]|uniref:DUF3899 domain-containing protein n=1 Tax=Flavivirga spongiicola TaxID=421621 RepID=A0ABU7XZX4_9FLAO|nr:hypothetical protein [Flavivirga sp. MEBiC05379]MDO5981133.1 hypothetical protein [Flavivirga sp. MEBiC05379]